MVGRFRTYKDSVYDFVPSPLLAMSQAGGLPIPLTTTTILYNHNEQRSMIFQSLNVRMEENLPSIL